MQTEALVKTGLVATVAAIPALMLVDKFSPKKGDTVALGLDAMEIGTVAAAGGLAGYWLAKSNKTQGALWGAGLGLVGMTIFNKLAKREHWLGMKSVNAGGRNSKGSFLF